MSTKAYSLDLRVTSTDLDKAQPIEIGLVEMSFVGGKLEVSEPLVEQCKPDEHIGFATMASTGITNEDLLHKSSHRKVLQRLMPVGYHYMIGHNITSRLRVIKSSGIDVCHYRPICTQSLAKYLVPNADNYKLKTLSYMFDYSFAKQYAATKGDAGMDALACARVLRQLCQLGSIHSFEQLHKVSLEIAIPTHFDFGSYKGQAIEDVARTPKGKEYLNWVVRNVSNNPFAVEACRRVLEGRSIRSPAVAERQAAPAESKFLQLNDLAVNSKKGLA